MSEKEQNLFLSAADQETADLYAELYEIPREDVAEQQVQKLKDRSLEEEDRVEVAILLMNETYTFDEVIQKLDAGKTVEELKKIELTLIVYCVRKEFEIHEKIGKGIVWSNNRCYDMWNCFAH